MDGLDADTSTAVTVRPGRTDDVDRLLEIHVAAFPDPRPLEVRRRVFLHNRLGGLEHLRVACIRGGDEPVGHAFSFPIEAWFGGREVAGRAVASVGVAVEARGQGVGRSLMGTIHTEAAERGDAFTLLYPFRQGFYGRLGYAPMSRHRVLTVSPRAIPAEWRREAPGIVRRALGDDRAAILRVYREAAQRGTGIIERPERSWDHDLLEERHHWLVLEHAGRVRAYVGFRLLQTEPHAQVRADVRELVSPDDAARRRLFAALGALGDQVRDVTIAMAEDDPLDWAFVDGDRDRGGTVDVEHAQGVVNTGPMMRLVSPERALSSRGYEASGAIDLAVDDAAPFTLDVSAGVGRVGPSSSSSPVRLSSQALATVAFGGLSLSAAARLGWVNSPDPSALARASSLLHLPPFFTLDAF